MLPKPTAEPAAAAITPNFELKESLFPDGIFDIKTNVLKFFASFFLQLVTNCAPKMQKNNSARKKTNEKA
jgi:hypothetical protein